MELRECFGFDHVPMGLSQGSFLTGYGMFYAGYPLLFTSHTVQYNHYVNSQGWIQHTGAANRTFGFKISDIYTIGTQKRRAFGVRIKLSETVSQVSGTASFIRLSNAVAPGTAGSPNVFSLSDLPDRQLGKEYYLEFEIVDDGSATAAVKRRIDGIAIADVTIVSGGMANYRAGNYCVALNGYTAVGDGTEGVRFRDFYMSEAEIAEATAMYGPVVLKRITLDSVAGSGWTYSGGGSLAGALNTKLPDTGDMTVPYVQNPTTEVPLTASLTASIGAADTIHAVSLSYTAKNSNGTAVNLSSKLEYNGTEVSLGSTPLTVSEVYNKRFPMQNKAPDGTAWTIGKLDATNLIFKPTTVGG